MEEEEEDEEKENRIHKKKEKDRKGGGEYQKTKEEIRNSIRTILLIVTKRWEERGSITVGGDRYCDCDCDCYHCVTC